MGRTYRSKRPMIRHGRKCRPVIHHTKTSNRKFIMVRAKSGGTRRLYLTDRGNIPTREQK